jgi:transposase InsO family protein
MSRTKAKSPPTNTICERLQRAIQEGSYSTAVRKTLNRNLDELQRYLDEWLCEYNAERSHSGGYYYGKTPLQTFLESRRLAQDKMLERTPNNSSGTRTERVETERSHAERSAGGGLARGAVP